MMKLLRRVVVLVFILSVAAFAAVWWNMDRQTGGNAPTITMEETSISLSITCTDEDILAGVTAYDHEDGSVTDSLIVESLSNFVEVGRRIATITAFDSDNNVTRTTREIVYSDYVSPKLSLDEPLRFAYSGTASIESPFTVTDCLDGDLSEAVTIDTDDSVYGTGTYTYTFQVVNSIGDTVSLTATVELYNSSEDRYCPHVELSEYLIYASEGDTIDPTDYIIGVTYASNYYSLAESDDSEDAQSAYTLDDIDIDNPVDTEEPGTYEITYTMRNGLYYQSVIRLIVIVE